MQEILNNLEETLLHIDNIMNTNNELKSTSEESTMPKDCEEDLQIIYRHTCESLMWFIIDGINIKPNDTRAYKLLVQSPYYQGVSEGMQNMFMLKMYEYGVFQPEMTVKELIDLLGNYPQDYKVKIDYKGKLMKFKQQKDWLYSNIVALEPVEE